MKLKRMLFKLELLKEKMVSEDSSKMFKKVHLADLRTTKTLSDFLQPVSSRLEILPFSLINSKNTKKHFEIKDLKLF